MRTSLSSSTPRASTATPRSSRDSERSSSPSSHNLNSPKVSPTLLRNKPSLIHTQSYPHSSQGLHTTTPNIPQTPHAAQDPDGMTIEALRVAYKKLQSKALDLQNKVALHEEKARSDQKKIQALELVLQREAASSPSSFSSSPSMTAGGRMAENKYVAQIDALSSKLYKLEEKNQAMLEEMTSLKSDLRNKKKQHESKIRELQLKHDFEMRNLEQQQRHFTSGLKKETRKDVDGLKQHLVVQETDLQKKHVRELQDLKTEHLERELQLKDTIHRLQDELDYVKQTGKRAAIRKTEVNLENETDDETTISIEGTEEEAAEAEEEEEEGDPEECY
eukprot:Phypoly_transcript_04226.p2 GENE.Phypoly_transcript_04226~~Phypoly_transcript_04226.p2  ORF type:complete len:333 (-),score=82.86 Phypoly_transcript_04226:1202-2200(-)